MNRIDRLFAILTVLQSRQYVPAEALADRFGISIRTVYRDVKALIESGIPVSFEPHRGYYIVQGYFLPPVAFSMEEANALLVSESLLSGFADKTTRKHFSTALSKVKAVLKGSQKEKIEQLSASIKLQVPSRAMPDFDYLATIQEAISNNTQLDLQYTNFKEEASKRTIEPIGLVFYAFNWHVIAWCHLRSDYRDFKVCRVVSLRSTGRPFQKEKHIPLGEYQLPVNY